MLYDVIIIGGGPAGCSAAVYTARKKLKTLLITESFGGQSIVSGDIQNWIGEPSISGYDLAQKFEKHVRTFAEDVEIKMPEKVTAIKAINCLPVHQIGVEGSPEKICDFEVTTDKNTYQAKSVILAAGARRRKLGLPGEDKLNGKGVAYCATCDAPLFSGKDVAVVGGGNAGLESAIDLVPYAQKIYVLEFADSLKGDVVTQGMVKKNPKIEIILNAKTAEILGDAFVEGLKYTDTKSGEEKTLKVEGVFVEIGSVPNSEIVKGLVDMDKYGQIIIDSKHGTTSHPGLFAAGDITDDPYKQNNISAGDAVKAALAAYSYLLKNGKK